MRKRDRVRARVLASAVALGLMVVPLESGSTASTVTAAQARWQPLPGLTLGHGQALTDVAWASGRSWFVVGSPTKLTVMSARVRGRALSSFETTRVTAPLGWYPIVLGSDVLYSRTRSASGVARLLPNGRVGPAAAASPEPMAKKVGVPVAAARVGERVVWALAGGVPVGEGVNYKPSLWACCDEAGAARDLTSLITRTVSSPPRGHALGVDAQGRLWLAWFDGTVVRGEIRIVQLDPATLAPQTLKALAAPVAGASPPSPASDPLALVCATTCRLVLEASYRLPSGGAGTRLVTWSPGERSATTLELDLDPDPEGYYRHPTLLSAGSRAGGLAVAYRYGSTDRGPTLDVAVGDARGRRLRTVGSIEQPARSRGRQMYTFHAGAFGPAGFVFAQTYSENGVHGHALATVVPFR